MARKKAGSAKPKRGKGRGAKPASTTEMTVEDGEVKQAKPPMSLESALVIVTLIALVAAFVLINVEFRASYGEGWPF